MQFIIKERAQLDEVLENTKDTVRILELERDNLNDKCSNMTNRIQEYITINNTLHSFSEVSFDKTLSLT